MNMALVGLLTYGSCLYIWHLTGNVVIVNSWVTKALKIERNIQFMCGIDTVGCLPGMIIDSLSTRKWEGGKISGWTRDK